MLRDIYKISRLVTALALVALVAASAARGADGLEERYRIQKYYHCCYGPSYYCPYCPPNSYVKRMNWGRTVPCGCEDCEEKEAWYRHCCCGTCLVPGSKPPCKCLDICLYHVIFPMSPWYSNPRDGICYPAFGSKSPTCVREND
jgi:hypothetical protein